jgi:hypothetical protein
MKNARQDQRRVKLRYAHDAATGRTTLTIDVEVPEDEMPHEHRTDLKEMAEELLGVPLGSLPEEIEVRLRRAGGHHEHEHGEHEGHEHEERRDEAARGKQGVKA